MTLILDGGRSNDLTIGRQNLNLPSYSNAILARASGENLNYATLAPQARLVWVSG